MSEKWLYNLPEPVRSAAVDIIMRFPSDITKPLLPKSKVKKSFNIKMTGPTTLP